MTDTHATPSLLVQRRIEARLIQAMLPPLQQELGRERAVALVRETVATLAQRFGREMAQASGADRPGLPELARVIPLWEQDGALEIEYLEQSALRLAFNVKRCRYAEMYRELGMAELGEVLSCSRDGEMCKGFNDRIRLTRTQTIMQGAEHCDFRYELDETPAADSP